MEDMFVNNGSYCKIQIRYKNNFRALFFVKTKGWKDAEEFSKYVYYTLMSALHHYGLSANDINSYYMLSGQQYCDESELLYDIYVVSDEKDNYGFPLDDINQVLQLMVSKLIKNERSLLSHAYDIITHSITPKEDYDYIKYVSKNTREDLSIDNTPYKYTNMDDILK